NPPCAPGPGGGLRGRNARLHHGKCQPGLAPRHRRRQRAGAVPRRHKPAGRRGAAAHFGAEGSCAPARTQRRGRSTCVLLSASPPWPALRAAEPPSLRRAAQRRLDPAQCPCPPSHPDWPHHKTAGSRAMHPILREVLTEPVGWLTIAGALIMFAMPVVTALFI